MTETDIGRAVQLYVEHMPDSFFLTLGRGFIAFLLKGLMRSRYGHCYVYEADGRVVGFIAATSDRKRLFKEMTARHFFSLCGFALRCVVKNPRAAFRILETAGYGLATQGPSLTPAEMLFVSIEPAHRRSGVCTALIEAIFNAYRQEGITQVQVSVLKNNEAVDNLLRGLGFTLARGFRVYGKDMLLYGSRVRKVIGAQKRIP